MMEEVEYGGAGLTGSVTFRHSSGMPGRQAQSESRQGKSGRVARRIAS